MKWRKQHAQILDKMTRKQAKALAAHLRTIGCGEWGEGYPFDDSSGIEPQLKPFLKVVAFPEDQSDQSLGEE